MPKHKRYSYSRTISGLRYIAKSPAPEYGGFNYEVVKIAQAALHYLTHPQRAKLIKSLHDITEKSSDLCAAKTAEALLSDAGYWHNNRIC